MSRSTVRIQTKQLPKRCYCNTRLRPCEKAWYAKREEEILAKIRAEREAADEARKKEALHAHKPIRRAPPVLAAIMAMAMLADVK